MFGLFKSSKQNESNFSASPQKGIAFYPDLITDLVDDHQQLERIHEKIKADFQKKDLKAVAAELKEFGTVLRNHLITENMRLYIYLQQKVEGDEVNSQLVRSFRKEMDGIAKPALDFLERYQYIESKSSSELASFVTELDKVGGEVHARMHREEETLYPLYASDY